MPNNPVLAQTWHPRVRGVAYVVMTIWAVLNVGGQAFMAGADWLVPDWWRGQATAFAALAAYTGLIAVANRPKTLEAQVAMHRAGESDHGADGLPDDNPQRRAD